MKFFEMSPVVSKHEFGIQIEDRPTEEQKARLMQILQASVAQGQVDFEDAVYIEQIKNLKQAQQVLAYRIKKKREDAERKAKEMQQMNGQIQQQSAMASEQAKQQTLQIEFQLKAEMEKIKNQHAIELQKQRYEFEMAMQEGKEYSSSERNLMNNLPTKELFMNQVEQAQQEQEANDGLNPNIATKPVGTNQPQTQQ